MEDKRQIHTEEFQIIYVDTIQELEHNPPTKFGYT